jgi:hypothetical protein
MEFYNTNITKFGSIFFHIKVSYLSFAIIVNSPVTTIIITINNQIVFFFRAIKPKTQHSSTSMTSRFTLTNVGKKTTKREWTIPYVMMNL